MSGDAAVDPFGACAACGHGPHAGGPCHNGCCCPVPDGLDSDGTWQCQTCEFWSKDDRDQCYECLSFRRPTITDSEPTS